MFKIISATNRLILRYRNQTMECSKQKIKLMRAHDLNSLFPVGSNILVKELYNNADNNIAIPLFDHPHDMWLKNNQLLETYKGKVITVSRREKAVHLLVQLSPNVLAFAEVNDFDGAENVEFVPYKYNRKTKKIYGCLVQ